MIVIVPLVIAIGVLAWVLRPGKKPNISRRNSIFATVIPALAVAIAAVSFQMLHNSAGIVEVSDISNNLFLVGIGLIGAYIIASVIFVITQKSDIAKGIGFGTCIAVVLSIVELGLLEWLGGV